MRPGLSWKRPGVLEASWSPLGALLDGVLECHTRYDTNLLKYGTIHAENFEDMVR